MLCCTWRGILVATRYTPHCCGALGPRFVLWWIAWDGVGNCSRYFASGLAKWCRVSTCIAAWLSITIILGHIKWILFGYMLSVDFLSDTWSNVHRDTWMWNPTTTPNLNYRSEMSEFRSHNICLSVSLCSIYRPKAQPISHIIKI